MARKYVKRDVHPESIRIAKCGHKTFEGRYFKCENCQPVLRDDQGDWNFFGEESDDLEEALEDACQE